MENNTKKEISFQQFQDLLSSINEHSPAEINAGTDLNAWLLSDEDYQNYDALENAYIRLMMSISQVLDTHESYLAGHSTRVALLSTEVARCMELPLKEIEEINLAGHLHDIGEIFIPADILHKSSPLSDNEMKIIHEHPARGAALIRVVKSLEPVARIVECHHEKFNGTGYPNQLAGKDIPLGARILAIIDTYDAITNFRLHRESGEHSKAVSVLKEFAGADYDPEILDIFIQMF